MAGPNERKLKQRKGGEKLKETAERSKFESGHRHTVRFVLAVGYLLEEMTNGDAGRETSKQRNRGK